MLCIFIEIVDPSLNDLSLLLSGGGECIVHCEFVENTSRRVNRIGTGGNTQEGVW